LQIEREKEGVKWGVEKGGGESGEVLPLFSHSSSFSYLVGDVILED
jgi:hypothetical protein